MLTKMVDGNVIQCDKEEELLIRKFWSLNEQYKDYSNYLIWDCASEPLYHILECKKHHRTILEKEIEVSIKNINLKIEEAEENLSTDLVKELILKRKKMKDLLKYDDSSWQTIEELQNHLNTTRGELSK